MGADSLAENTPNVPQIYLPNLSAQDQKFGISKEKKASLGVRSPWFGVLHKRGLIVWPKMLQMPLKF